MEELRNMMEELRMRLLEGKMMMRMASRTKRMPGSLLKQGIINCKIITNHTKLI